MRRLICGCKTCGCLCEEHSRSGEHEPCMVHVMIGELPLAAFCLILWAVMVGWTVVLG